MKFFTIKRVLILGVIVAAVVCLLPTFTNTWPHKKINLGLDLQGGMHLILEVQSEEAVNAELDRTISQLKLDLKNEKIQHMGIDKASDHKIIAKISGADNKSGVEKLLSDEYAGLEIPSVKNISGGISFTLRLPDKESDSIKKMATEQALETIRNRIDEFGVSEPDIRIQSGNRILLQLPGISDPERAKGLIGKTAQLTFQLVDEQGDVNAALRGKPPVGDEILYQLRKNAGTGNQARTPFLIKKHVELDGSQLTNARVEFDQFQQPQVGIEFSRKGARTFERITGANINKRLAIVLDKNVYSAPNIQDRISGGKAVITGHFTLEEATDLAIALRAGSLPAPVKIIEERTVGPTLGADSVRTGLMSMLVGGALVVLFMVIYYRGAGLIADIALVVNIFLIGGGLAFFGATLTLPGIAGIILTIGMAVDANVIIFERIREELRAGRSPRAAVNAGYDRATLTVMDANVTTLIAAAVLFQFGTGPIKGFAVTLGLGIVASLFTALILSKSIYDMILANKQSDTLSI
ncbi:protein translocase subunit SecD [Desulfobacter hydrogenophilus]|uniref:Protein translocase subunit SecD n=1 Tax=Desulfobacter hydrogenophilus TaxID=2291 RepID=A0A328FGT4_9BACT|nr:protein translocase subunit SecD [Desulfobacter hydrogenophilus]NDY70599.1 protein translocase subunit SecD [Desulfobacter hydrogenophilus]QBH13968.1 protein translocase subunit SecD [Desulfobacter hydrogenophilus]RAM03619.1 protein translocase subunit SecD [Desulfobacter hydrogenophilus]